MLLFLRLGSPERFFAEANRVEWVPVVALRRPPERHDDDLAAGLIGAASPAKARLGFGSR